VTKRKNESTESQERRKQARLHKLGTNTPTCATCGNNDWRCIEEHHPDTRKRDNLVVLLCANHHRLVTHNQKDHPEETPGCDELLARIGNFLLGLADMLNLILERLYEYGETLIERANAFVPKAEGRT
jgi:hypothetical protein